MSQAILISHLPLLRMERAADLPFGDGLLTKLPWEQFDGLTQGAFSDWKRKYVLTDPAFFWYEPPVALPFVKAGNARGMEEMKLPQEAWPTLLPRLGFGLLNVFHEQLVDPVWAALALAAPAGVLPPPRSSVSFMLPAGEAYFEFGERTSNGVRLQGDADLELAYLPEATHVPLDDQTLATARTLLPLARFALGNPVVSPALRQLLTCGDLTLAAPESLLLAVAAIESLLLPDVTVGSGEMFARRLAHLLGTDDTSQTRIHGLARSLYRHRTALLHADDAARDHGNLPPAAAEQLLASATIAVTNALASGVEIADLRRKLDEPGGSGFAPSEVLRTAPPGRCAPHRLGPNDPWQSGTSSTGGDLSSPEGTILSWSPLIGLTHEGEPWVHRDLGVAVTSISAAALVGMEEKDIRRDFISEVRVGGALAALAIAVPHPDLNVTNGDAATLTRRRDVAVAGLRMAGAGEFADPELLGWYIYARSLRYRRETVLRQSVIMRLQQEETAVMLSAEARSRVWELWSLLARYEREARDPEIDRLLDLVRRIHDRRFLPTTTRAALALVAVESLLGRFRPPTATLRLERLVRLLHGVPEETARWFETNGRAFRNQVAHGEWKVEPTDATVIWTRNPEPIAHLVTIACAALQRLIEVWVAAAPPVRARYGPARLLVRDLARQPA